MPPEPLDDWHKLPDPLFWAMGVLLVLAGLGAWALACW